MSKNTKTTKTVKGAKGASKKTTKTVKGAAIKRVLAKGRDEFAGAPSRTARIETFIVNSRAPVTVKEIETALSDVFAVRNHVNTLFHKQLLGRDTSGAQIRYFVRPELLKKLAAKKSK